MLVLATGAISAKKAVRASASGTSLTLRSPAFEVYAAAQETIMSDDTTPVRLDLRGLKCPLPALRTRKALKQAAAGQRFIVECTDALSTIDIPNLLRETGDLLEGQETAEGLHVFRIRRS
jgi:tRNA 2-thiouridine synthesizing protein A